MRRDVTSMTIADLGPGRTVVILLALMLGYTTIMTRATTAIVVFSSCGVLTTTEAEHH